MSAYFCLRHVRLVAEHGVGSFTGGQLSMKGLWQRSAIIALSRLKSTDFLQRRNQEEVCTCEFSRDGGREFGMNNVWRRSTSQMRDE
jgi:hypothetical protein